MSINIPILTYHSLHAPGWQYEDNDHTALSSDLLTLVERGYSIVPLRRLFEHLTDDKWKVLESGKWVGLSFDDGTDHDFIDFYAVGYGYLRSFFSIVCDYLQHLKRPDLPGAVATSFVIASASARNVLDKTCIAGRGQWSSRWWYPAQLSGVIDIGNHSWDHLHPSLPGYGSENFSSINNEDRAHFQIRQAEQYIGKITSYKHSKLFAYPEGISTNFLTQVYFPSTANPGINAAFTTEGEPVCADSNIWELPRFVCGEHWKTQRDFVQLLKNC